MFQTKLYYGAFNVGPIANHKCRFVVLRYVRVNTGKYLHYFMNIGGMFHCVYSYCFFTFVLKVLSYHSSAPIEEAVRLKVSF